MAHLRRDPSSGQGHRPAPPAESTRLGLVWAVLDRASLGWRGVVMTPVAVRQLQDLRRQLFSPTAIEEAPTESTGTVTAAA